MRANFDITFDYLWKVQRAQAFRRWKLVLIALSLIAVSIVGRWLVFREFDWLSGLALSAVGFFLLVTSAVLVRGYRFAKYYVSVQGDEPVRYEFADDHLSTKSKHAELAVPWGTMRSLTRGKHHWLLRTASGAALTLPVAQMSPELQSHITELARRHGLKLL